MILCKVCHRVITVTRTVVVCLHGSVNNCCLGSHLFPATSVSSAVSVTSITSATSADFQFSVSPVVRGTCTSQPALAPLPNPLPPRCLTKVIKIIPRGSRDWVVAKLASILELVCRVNDQASYFRLFRFWFLCLQVPARGGHRRSLSDISRIWRLLLRTDVKLFHRTFLHWLGPRWQDSSVYLSVFLRCKPDWFAEEGWWSEAHWCKLHATPPCS